MQANALQRARKKSSMQNSLIHERRDVLLVAAQKCRADVSRIATHSLAELLFVVPVVSLW
jgi:hypothetical protein